MITENQLHVIKMIEYNLSIKFEGESKEEARNFISSHISESKRVSDHYKKLLLSEYKGYKEIWNLLSIIPKNKNKLSRLTPEEMKQSMEARNRAWLED